jgi:hypothetical protein
VIKTYKRGYRACIMQYALYCRIHQDRTFHRACTPNTTCRSQDDRDRTSDALFETPWRIEESAAREGRHVTRPNDRARRQPSGRRRPERSFRKRSTRRFRLARRSPERVNELAVVGPHDTRRHDRLDTKCSPTTLPHGPSVSRTTCARTLIKQLTIGTDRERIIKY